MNGLESCLLLLAIPLGMIAAGYWLAAAVPALSAAQRLAVAMLAGLGALIWSVSVVNLVLPLNTLWGWCCVVPWLVPLLRPRLREGLVRDLAAMIGSARGAALAAGAVVLLGALLWPLLTRPDVVYYEGTSGHDGFFWVVGAEHLKRQTYLQQAVTNPVYPLYYSIESIVGLHPVWGRMGGEGLLALTSNLAGASPLKIYVVATAALFFPWVAAVFLVTRTFLLTRTTLGCALALVLLQPVFLFFHANANLPNLMGALAGATAVVTLQRALTEPSPRWPWLVLLALGAHGLMCCYPEMIPGIALTGTLLLGRAWWVGQRAALWPALGAIAAGLLINPATTLRAGSGLVASLITAAHSEAQGSIFDKVSAAARLPAMVTLSSSLGQLLGAAGGMACALLVMAAAGFAVWRARDRFGAMAMLAGGAAILVYTLVQDYPYGWQKTVQFCGVFLAALLPCGIVGHVETLRIPDGARWRSVLPLGAAIAVFFGCATVVNLLEIHKWAGRKYLTQDWFAAREFSRKALHNVPVEVEAGSFDRPFFYTMWAAYFLDESRVYFTPDQASAGYLRPSIQKYPPDWRETPRVVLISGQAAAQSGATALWRSESLGFALRPPSSPREPKQ